MEDLHTTWNHRWIHPNAKSEDSDKHGLGVFATGSINKGNVVGVLGGIIVPRKEIGKYWDEMGHVGIQCHEEYYVVPSSREELEETGVFNHSCNPNIGFSGDIFLVAMRDIEEGEELVFDYAFCESDFESFECNCESENCRGNITKNDWMNKQVQDKYFDYFAPYMKKKIERISNK